MAGSSRTSTSIEDLVPGRSRATFSLSVSRKDGAASASIRAIRSLGYSGSMGT